jgi:hypothetical protein
MHVYRHVLAIAVVAWIAIPLARAQTDDRVQDLASANFKVRHDALQSLDKSRADTIQKLMSLVRKQKTYDHTDTTVLAIQALGILRAAEAADLLAGMIGMEAQLPNFETTDVEMSFPATAALVRIGSPALTPLTRVILESDEATSQHRAAWAISRILGSELAEAHFQQQRLKATPEGARRIESAVDSLAINRRPTQ